MRYHRPVIKVCGMTKQSDVAGVVGIGAQMCGFIFHTKSPRYISPSRAAKIQTALVKRVGVFVNQSVEQILHTMNEARLDYVQLHGNYSVADAMRIGADKVIRVMWPERYVGKEDFEHALNEYASSCSLFLFDAGQQGGGHGSTLNWQDLTQVKIPKPWLLAGGLTPQNTMQALSVTHAYGLDLNSGVEQGAGQKSPTKLLAALNGIH